MDVRLDGKVAVVTGASRGIGEAIATEFLMSGAAGVVITSRRQENLDEAAAAILDRVDARDRLMTQAARADSEEDARATIERAVDRFGACDILVNNAGTNPAPGTLAEVDLGALDKTWAVNQRAPILWAREAWRQWMGEHGGTIINVASVGGMRPTQVLGAYNISKAALIFTTQQLALEMAPIVRVNAVAPAVVKTRLSAALWASGEDEAAATHPLKRLGEPRDVANAVTFLASEAASWITGIVLPVDGGVTGAGGSLT
jgi:NAD(P)-dependent dehydrogenase (short-subunit alcohol dehydrogenase family)